MPLPRATWLAWLPAVLANDLYAYDDFDPALNFTRCAGVVDRVHISSVTASPSPAVPGKALCFTFEAMPDRPIEEGGWVIEFETPAGSIRDVPVCGLDGVACPVPAHTTVSGRVCGKVPMDAILFGGTAVDVTIWVLASAGSDEAAGCVETRLAVGTSLAVDEVAEDAHAKPHAALRRALQDHLQGEDGPTRASLVTEEDVRVLLLGLYERRPEWYSAFDKWRVREGKGARHYPTAVEEARAFDAFRTNVLHASRAGKPQIVDEHSDLHPEARRTLSHFA